jgi:flagellar biosynthesis protein FlhG
VASGKGGVGKTTLSVNLAVAVAQRGTRVTLLDADFGTANADVLCGVTPGARLDHVFMPGAGGERWSDGGARSIKDIAVNAPGGFRLIPGTTGVARMADMSAAERQAIVSAMDELDADTDVLIIDAGAGVGRSVTTFMAAADVTLVVATPEPTSIADAYALIKCAAAVQGEESMAGLGGGERSPVALVLNQVMDSAEAARVHARISAVCDRFLGLKCPLLGWVAQDVRVAQAVRSREPLLVRWPAAGASGQIRDLAWALTHRLGVEWKTGGTRGGEGGGRGARGLVRRLLGI